MKKLIIFAALLPILVTAQNISGDTLVIKQPTEVIIIKSEGRTVVEVNGKEDNPDYSYQLNIGEELSNYTEEKISSWDFNFPFNKNKKRAQQSIEVSPSFGFGLVNAVNATSGVKIDMGSSYEFTLNNLISYEYRINNNALSVGFGLNWRNYRMTGRTRFIKEGNDILLGNYPENAEIQFSRIKVFSLTVPFLLNGKLNRKCSYSLGPVINFNTSASIKTRYKENGESQKLIYENIHQTPVTVDLMAVVRCRSLGLYFKYTPTRILKHEFAPQFEAISTGICLNL